MWLACWSFWNRWMNFSKLMLRTAVQAQGNMHGSWSCCNFYLPQDVETPTNSTVSRIGPCHEKKNPTKPAAVTSRAVTSIRLSAVNTDDCHGFKTCCLPPKERTEPAPVSGDAKLQFALGPAPCLEKTNLGRLVVLKWLNDWLNVWPI